jgi:tryptophan synthase alpha chain
MSQEYLEKRFDELRTKGEKALIAYICAGDPSLEMTVDIAKTVLESADILEIGIPFSDPIADGPTIQAASQRALKAGTDPVKVFEVVKKIRKLSDKPLLFMTYYNILYKYGLEKFCKKCAEVGINGLIIPDLPPEESDELKKLCEKSGISLVFLIAQTTTEERMRKIVDVSSGFIYLVSLLGVTGEREKLSDKVEGLIEKVRKHTKKPLAVGFGISKPEHVRQVIKAGADGAIVGSAIIKVIEKNLGNKEKMLSDLKDFVSSLKSATVLK